MADWNVKEVRRGNRSGCILFIHGFTGKPDDTWGNFPHLMAAQPDLAAWDLLNFGYPTDAKLDAPGLWHADPDIQTIADGLRTYATVHLQGYRDLVVLAHSMGGLVAQRWLLDDDSLPERLRTLFLFGTPSRGDWKALPFRLPVLRALKRQARDLALGSPFLKRLRAQWDQAFGKSRPFKLFVVAGERDGFVLRSSSHGPFPHQVCHALPGDHLSLVKPQGPADASVELVVKNVPREPAPEPLRQDPARACHPPAGTALHRTVGEWLHGAGLRLDRGEQWGSMKRLAQEDESSLVLVHGPRRQSVKLFLARIKNYLNPEVPNHAHEFKVVPLRQHYSRPRSASAWENRLKAALAPHREGTAAELLAEVSQRSALFLLLAGGPLRPKDLKDEAEVEALEGFLGHRLPALLRHATRSHPIRVLLALDYEGDTELKDRLHAQMQQGARTHGLRYHPLPPLSPVTWDHVEQYLHEQGPPPPQAFLDQLRHAFDEIQKPGLTFDEIAEFLDDRLR